MDSETLKRICINGVCHCDWRLTLKNCEEHSPMVVIHSIHIGICAITVILGMKYKRCFIVAYLISFEISGTTLLCHRLFIKGHQLFDINLSKGCFRPKPIDCMLLFIVLFNIREFVKKKKKKNDKN